MGAVVGVSGAGEAGDPLQVLVVTALTALAGLPEVHSTALAYAELAQGGAQEDLFNGVPAASTQVPSGRC